MNIKKVIFVSALQGLGNTIKEFTEVGGWMPNMGEHVVIGTDTYVVHRVVHDYPNETLRVVVAKITG